MVKRTGLVAALALIVVAFTAVPAVPATKTDKKQNKSIKALKKDAAELESGLDGATAGLAQLGGDLTALDNTLSAGLEQAMSSIDQVDTALNQLDAAFNGYVNSPEYGLVQLYFDPENNGFEADDAVSGQLLTTADIPDDTNQATTSGTLILAVPDGTTAKPIGLKAAIRSGESDGTGAANPVGVAGVIAMSAEMIGAPGTTSIGGGNPGTGGTLPLTSAPNAALGGLPVYPIPDKAALVGANPVVFPDAQATELIDATRLQSLTGAANRFTVTNTSGAPSHAIFTVTARFNDLTPASPGNLEE
jgi:hypothetical protein